MIRKLEKEPPLDRIVAGLKLKPLVFAKPIGQDDSLRSSA